MWKFVRLSFSRVRTPVSVEFVALPDGSTAYSFTMFQGPGMPDELFDAQHASLQRELANLERILG